MKRRVALLTALVLLVAGIFAGLVFADGTETLGPASVSLAAGTGIATGGTGLTNLNGGALSGTISVEVPAGASVEQVLLYWHGVFRPSNPPATTEVDVNANTVTGEIIGGPTFIPGPASQVATYRADITGLGLVSAGANNLDITGTPYADLNNNGAGVIVIYDDGVVTSTIDIRDGNDFVAIRESEVNNVATLMVTVPQTFGFAAAAFGRTANLSLFGADANGARTSTIKVTVGAVVTEFSNTLQDTDGRSWDTVDLIIDIPAGETSLTVEVIADGDNDFTGIWIASALSLGSEDMAVFARITGGGWRTTGSNSESVRSSQGFTLHCDITLSNNLQVNWDGGQKWHINKLVDFAYCEDNLDYTPEPPASPADTYVGLDVGKLNNVDGSVACFRFEDHGEVANDPDGPDQALLRIWAVGFDPGISEADLADPAFDCLASTSDPTTDPNTVLFVPLSDVQGNLQFHFDQPHKFK